MNHSRLFLIPGAVLAASGLVVAALLSTSRAISSPTAGTAIGYNLPTHIPELPSLHSQMSGAFGPASDPAPEAPLQDSLFLVPNSAVDTNAGAHLLRPASITTNYTVVGAVSDPERTPMIATGHAAPVTGAAPAIAATAAGREHDDIGFDIIEMPKTFDPSSMSITDLLAQGGVDFSYTFRAETPPSALTQQEVARGNIAVVNVNGETAWAQRISDSVSQLTMWFTDSKSGKRLLLTLHANKSPDELVQIARHML